MTNVLNVTPEPADAQIAVSTLDTTTDASKYSLTWWKDTADRVVSTAAQTAIATIGVNVVGVLDLDWIALGSITAGAAALAFLKALAVTKSGS